MNDGEERVSAGAVAVKENCGVREWLWLSTFILTYGLGYRKLCFVFSYKKLKQNFVVNLAYCAHLLGGEDRTDILWDALGEEDFFLGGGEAPLEGEDTLPECSSEVTAHLALWELSERSLQSKTGLKSYIENILREHV